MSGRSRPGRAASLQPRPGCYPPPARRTIARTRPLSVPSGRGVAIRFARAAVRTDIRRPSNAEGWRAPTAPRKIERARTHHTPAPLYQDADYSSLPASHRELRRISRRVAGRPGPVSPALHPPANIRRPELRTRRPEGSRQPTARLCVIARKHHPHPADPTLQGKKQPSSGFRTNAQPRRSALPAGQHQLLATFHSSAPSAFASGTLSHRTSATAILSPFRARKEHVSSVAILPKPRSSPNEWKLSMPAVRADPSCAKTTGPSRPVGSMPRRTGGFLADVASYRHRSNRRRRRAPGSQREPKSARGYSHTTPSPSASRM